MPVRWVRECVGSSQIVATSSKHITSLLRTLGGKAGSTRQLVRNFQPPFTNRECLASGRIVSLLGIDHHALRRCHARHGVPCVIFNNGILCQRASVRGLLASGCHGTVPWGRQQADPGTYPPFFRFGAPSPCQEVVKNTIHANIITLHAVRLHGTTTKCISDQGTETVAASVLCASTLLPLSEQVRLRASWSYETFSFEATLVPT